MYIRFLSSMFYKSEIGQLEVWSGILRSSVIGLPTP
jgi:hypothetical protein